MANTLQKSKTKRKKTCAVCMRIRYFLIVAGMLLLALWARPDWRLPPGYDYSAIVYKSFKTPIKIRCREHPVRLISITPERHLVTTGGCKYCLREKRIINLERELNRACAEPAVVMRPFSHLQD